MNLSPLPLQKFFDNAGNPLNGGLLFTYVTGTTTKIATYQDQAGTPNTNPVVLNFRGEANVWLDQTLTYKFVLAPSTDTDPPSNPIWSVDNISAAVTYASLTAQIIGQILYPRNQGEINAAVTPANFAYPIPDLRRYGCAIDGTGNNSTNIQNAILASTATGGVGYILHPGGNIAHSSQILFGNRLTVYGADRSKCVFTYTGTASAWRSTNNGSATPTPNTSGFGLVRFTGVQIITASGSNTGAAIELSACGYSYYRVDNCWLTGTFKYGLIIDGCEVSDFHDNIISVNDGTAVAGKGGGIWLVAGPDRSAGQGYGFTNVITVKDNQIDVGSGGICIIDDGGANHHFLNNNLNGGGAAAVLAAVLDFTFTGHDMENAGAQTLQYNVLVTDTQYVSGTVRVPSRAGTIEDNSFSMDMAIGGSALTFGGSTMQPGMTVQNNSFRFSLGRTGGAIDVTQLANSYCGENTDEGHQSQAHYFGIHNDVYGNKLLPPTTAPQWKPLTAYSALQNGQVVFNSPNFYVCKVSGTSAGAGGPTGTGTGIVDGTVTWDFTTNTVSPGYTQGGPIYGDSRYPNQFLAGIAVGQSSTAPVTAGGGTIATAGLGVSRVAPAGNIANVIMQAGTLAGQKCTVINESAAAGHTITFAAAGSNVALNGIADTIVGQQAASYTWDGSTNLWYRSI